VHVDPLKPKLKPPGIKHLKLKYEEPLLNCAFNFNMRRYSKVAKNKVAPPYKTAEFDMMFGRGIVPMGCMLDAADDMGRAGQILLATSWDDV